MTKNYYLWGAFVISIILTIASFSLFYVKLADVTDLLIVHFESFRGADFLGNKSNILGMIISGALINSLNIFLAWLLYEKNHLFSYLIAVVNILISLLILLNISAIIAIN